LLSASWDVCFLGIAMLTMDAYPLTRRQELGCSSTQYCASRRDDVYAPLRIASKVTALVTVRIVVHSPKHVMQDAKE
jgi:hypothetical protein